MFIEEEEKAFEEEEDGLTIKQRIGPLEDRHDKHRNLNINNNSPVKQEKVKGGQKNHGYNVITVKKLVIMREIVKRSRSI